MHVLAFMWTLMGLDATVYCDCFAKGQIKEPPSPDWRIYYTEDGSLDCHSKDLTTQLAFDAWLHDRACEHEDGVLIGHWLGNIALVGLLREDLSSEAESYPLLLTKVLYSGTHAGDYIPVGLLESLRIEVHRLAGHQCKDQVTAEYVQDFHRKMFELLEAAQRLNKPISF